MSFRALYVCDFIFAEMGLSSMNWRWRFCRLHCRRRWLWPPIRLRLWLTLPLLATQVFILLLILKCLINFLNELLVLLEILNVQVTDLGRYCLLFGISVCVHRLVFFINSAMKFIKSYSSIVKRADQISPPHLFKLLMMWQNPIHSCYK